MAKLINFRCPESLEADITKIGLEFYPKPVKDESKDRGYDLTATILAILQAGIDSITSNGLCLTKDKTERNTVSLTSHKTEDITELRDAIAKLKKEFKDELEQTLANQETVIGSLKSELMAEIEKIKKPNLMAA